MAMTTPQEKRSEIDSRLEAEKRSIEERRSGFDRRRSHESSTTLPSNEQLALFVRRFRRTMRDEKSRSFLGVAIGEGDFAPYPDVIRVLEWMERLISVNTNHNSEHSLKHGLRKDVTAAPATNKPT
jgi:hypothetical protein